MQAKEDIYYKTFTNKFQFELRKDKIMLFRDYDRLRVKEIKELTMSGHVFRRKIVRDDTLNKIKDDVLEKVR